MHKGVAIVYVRGVAEVPMASAGRWELRSQPVAPWLLHQAQSPLRPSAPDTQARASWAHLEGWCSGCQPEI